MTTLKIYTVTADAETGEWIGQAEDTGRAVEWSEWIKRTDTDETHYDTFEVDDVTCAIEVHWIK